MSTTRCIRHAAPAVVQLTAAHLRLIEALARADVADYLREQAAAQRDSVAARPNHVPLPSAQASV